MFQRIQNLISKCDKRQPVILYISKLSHEYFNTLYHFIILQSF